MKRENSNNSESCS